MWKVLGMMYAHTKCMYTSIHNGTMHTHNTNIRNTQYRSFLFADRVRISNSSGVVPAQGNATITVQYNVVQLSFPGVYLADILITTDGQPIVTVC